MSDVADAYDAWAGSYDQVENRTRDLDAAVLRREGPDPSGRVVLEVGCGTGKNTVWLAARARAVLALDVSPGMLRRAQARTPSTQVAFARADIARAWPVAAGAADLVVANLVLEHVRDLGPVFEEAARVLRAGGELFLCELHPYRQLEGARARFVAADGSEARPPAFLHEVSEYLNAALSAGLRLLEAGEWRDADAAPSTPPRLLSLRFAAP